MKTTKARTQASGDRKDVCPKCSQRVLNSDRAMCCDFCESWYHINCAEITPEFYKNVVKQKKSNFKWYCDECEQKIHSLSMIMKRMQDKQEELENKLMVLEEEHAQRLTMLENRLSNLEEKGNANETEQNVESPGNGGDATKGQGNVKEVVKECLDRDRRRNNLMIFRLQEKETEEEEWNQLEEIMKDIEVRNVRPYQVIRIGKKTETSIRPLRLKLDGRDKAAIMRNAPKLRNSVAYSNISISFDLTPQQRVERKRHVLQKYAEQRMREAGTDDQSEVGGGHANEVSSSHSQSCP